MSDLIWIQTVCHSDGIAERIFRKNLIMKKISRQKSMQNYPVGKEITLCILMDFPIHIDTISNGLPIVYFKGSSNMICFCH